MLSANDVLIWRRGWEDTFTSIGRTREECHQWLRDRIIMSEISHAITFDMLRAGMEQFDKVKRGAYPEGAEGDLIYKSYLAGQIYLAMTAAKES